jgi:dolichol-phosphate mannosyltransferase
MDKIIVVMPTYNEVDNIGRMIDMLCMEIFPLIKGIKMGVLVVDDNSPDETGKVVKGRMRKYENVFLLSGQKKGLGYAYVRGMRFAMDHLHADAIIEMDADFQHPPILVKSLVDAYLRGADCVMGSRYIRGGSVPKEWALYRRFISFFGNFLIRLCFPGEKIHDYTTGFRLTRVNGVLGTIELEKLRSLDRFASKVDLLNQIMRRSRKVVEVPLKFVLREREVSKFNAAEIIETLRIAFAIGLQRYYGFLKFGMIGFFGYFVNAVTLWFFTKMMFPSVLAWTFSTEISILNNFFLNNIWTFRERRVKGMKQWFSKMVKFHYLTVSAVILQILLGVFSDYLLGEEYRQISLPIIILALFPYKYVLSKKFIWRTDNK